MSAILHLTRRVYNWLRSCRMQIHELQEGSSDPSDPDTGCFVAVITATCHCSCTVQPRRGTTVTPPPPRRQPHSEVADDEPVVLRSFSQVEESLPSQVSFVELRERPQPVVPQPRGNLAVVDVHARDSSSTTEEWALANQDNSWG